MKHRILYIKMVDARKKLIIKNVSRETYKRLDKFHMKHFKGCFRGLKGERKVIYCVKRWKIDKIFTVFKKNSFKSLFF